jgi:peptidoglycan/LPS O-acetylase OafA/YrhL
MDNSLKPQRVYFPNLNGLRFIAAFVVLIHHIDATVLSRFRQFNPKEELYYRLHLKALSGHIGVILFFVLSGFLISYLLLLEKKQATKINIRHFYIRRILRIWPLYFLVISCAILILFTNIVPDPKTLAIQILFFLFFLPHLLRATDLGTLPYSNHTWSIGVEEQFYFLWPVFIQKIRLKILLPLILSLIGLIIIIKGIFFQSDLVQVVLDMVHMMIGSLFAIIYFQKERFTFLLKILYSIPIQLIAFSILLGLIISGWEVPFIRFEIYSLCFGIIILNLATNPQNFIKLEQPIIHYLGKISYGIYMLHPFCLLCSEQLLDLINGYNVYLHYFMSIGLTITVASLSYHYFEKFFLRFKPQYSTVISGAAIKEEHSD